jgi:hypothetical protein
LEYTPLIYKNVNYKAATGSSFRRDPEEDMVTQEMRIHARSCP